SLQRAYREKTVLRSLTVPHGYGFGAQGAKLKHNDRHKADQPRPSPHAPILESRQALRQDRARALSHSCQTHPSLDWGESSRGGVQYWNYGRVLEPARTLLAGIGQTHITQELGG